MTTSDIPIMVSGHGRSGTTWLQFFLSQHPRIHIHGQLPNLPWGVTWDWYQTLIRHGKWAEDANATVGYDIPHYAGSAPRRCAEIFKTMFMDYMTGFGPQKPRWGLKAIGYCSSPDIVAQFETLWPDALWVVCIRDPFAAIASAKNTFTPDSDIMQKAAAWVQACRFVDSHDANRVTTFQIDKTSQRALPNRYATMKMLLTFLGEEPSMETEEFVRRWPVIHKVTPERKRHFSFTKNEKRQLLEDVPDLAHYMEEWGYSTSC